ncbi:amino acid adenylation domain-containing protein [Streptomyces sp. NBC_00057]|uniref:amino acid adenylation domain-containing protein n=1 Tax=Streptomyces sp. NBC_00057 TaxID=2975634 RepID=UPI0032565FEE
MDKLAEPAPALQFPVRDAAAPDEGTPRDSFSWDIALSGPVDRFPALVRAVFAVLLHRYSGQDDLALTYFPARTTKVPARPVVLRSRIEDAGTVADLAAALTAEAAGSGVAVPDSGLRAAVAGAVAPEDVLGFHLLLEAVPAADGARCTFHYDPARFTESFVSRMAANLHTLFLDAAARPGSPVRQLRLLSDEETRYLLREVNATERPYPRESSLHALVEAQAARTPQAPAVDWNGEILTYAELDARANRIARVLGGLGIAPGSRVGVSTGRTQHTVTLLLGIHKAGCAYVPLDPAYPAERLRAIAATAAMSAVVTTGEDTPDWLDGVDVLPVTWQTLLEKARGEDAGGVPPAAGPQDATHLIYTSGSTGSPKGVVISHHNVVALLAWAWDTYRTEDVSRVLFSTSLNFDLSVFELWVPLTMGGCVVVVDNVLALAESPGLNPSLVNTVPSALRVLLQRDAVPACTGVLNVAGEPLPKELVNSAFDSTRVQRLYNLYGPSEDTTYSTWKCFTGPVADNPTIGVPIHNTAAYLLDAHGQLVPRGAVGELHLAGAGVSQGYAGDPDRTAEVFVASPAGLPAATLYRTGDLARWTEDGELYFLGRRDNQVKVRGFRIELGEIESVVREVVGLRDVAVLAVAAEDGARLVCYVGQAGDEADVARLRDRLGRRLPHYMQPAKIVFDEALPLLPNGKVDRKTLLVRRVDWAEGSAAGSPPDGADQVAVARVWSRLLGLEQLGSDLDFFSVGGHSLLATLLAARLGEEFGVVVKVAELYRNRTVTEQVRMIRDKRERATAAIGSSTEARLRAVAETLWESARGHGVPGASAAVYIDGELGFTHYGFDDAEQRISRSAQSRQRITCVTKALLAFVALRLVDRGLLGLDEPLDGHLPQAFRRRDGRTVKVTLRQLLSHTSGIDDSYEVWHETDFDDLEKYVTAFGAYGQLFEPGTVFAYSACGTSIVAALIGKLLGMPWRRAVNELLFVPLGIEEIPETLAEDGHYGDSVSGGHLWNDKAQAYLRHDPVPQTVADDAAGPFSICLTIGELAQIALLALNDGVTAQGERLLSEELARQMRTPQVDVPGHHFMHAWGLGWLMFGPSAFGFNSNGSGHHNFIQIFPEEKSFLLLLANAYPVFGLYEDLLRSLTGKGLVHTDRSFDLELSDCVGRYESDGYRITVHRGTEHLGYAYAERQPDGSWADLDEGDLVLSGAGGFSSISERNVLAGSISFIPAPGTRTPAFARVGQRFVVKVS